jgi:hypothetical protein
MLFKSLEATDRSTRCSQLDGLMRLISPRIAFCYPERLDAERLRDTLQHVLADYSAFAGRLSRSNGTWNIVHDGSVVFETAERRHESSFEVGVAADSNARPACPDLNPALALAGKRPLLAARLTQTSDGSVLGIRWHHMAGDLHSAMHLLRSWASAYNGEAHRKPLEVADREAFAAEHIPQNGPVPMRVASWSECLRFGWQLTTAVRLIELNFTAEEVASLHAAAQRTSWVTEHDAVCGQVYALIRSARRSDRPAYVSLSVNLRKHLKLSPDLLGNYLDQVSMLVEPDDDAAAIAAGIRARLSDIARQPFVYHTQRQLKAVPLSRRMRTLPVTFDPAAGALILTSWCNFGLHDLRFGSTTPVLVHGSPVDKAIGAGFLLDRPNESGFTVRVWLPPALAERVVALHQSRQNRPTEPAFARAYASRI